MRAMSFMLTTEQMRNRSKSVTRRLGWNTLKPGDRIIAAVKCQGLGKGGKATLFVDGKKVGEGEIGATLAAGLALGIY